MGTGLQRGSLCGTILIVLPVSVDGQEIIKMTGFFGGKSELGGMFGVSRDWTAGIRPH